MIPNTPPGPRLPLHRSTSGYQSSTSDTPQRHNVGTSYFSQPRRPSSPSPGHQRPALARSLSLTGSRTASDARPHGKGRHDEADLLSEDDEEDAYGSDVRHGQEAHLDESPDAQDSDGEDVDDTTKEDDPITVRDRQSLINVEHPFGLPIWKPALYKKSRTVTRNADQALHSIPSAQAERHLLPGNVLWTLCFGWWLAVICFVIAGILFVIPYGGRNYSTLVFGLGWYLAWPFGKYVEGDLTKDDFPQADEERPQLFDEDPSHHDATLYQEDEETSALPSEERHNPRTHPIFTETSTLLRPAKVGTTLHGPSRSYGATSSPRRNASATKGMVADEWLGKLCFWLALLTVIVPLMLLVSLVCWGLIVAIPMAKLNWALLKHLIQHPTSIRFCSAPSAVLVPSAHFTSAQGSVLDDDAIVPEIPAAVERTRLAPGQVAPFGSPTSTVLLCIYRAGDWQYFKYTVGGVNIFFINLLPVVFFVIFDGFVILPFVERREQVGRHVPGIVALLGSRVLVFLLSLLSVIPLSYFIGMAVASISAQSSIGMGAVINASFGSIVEVLLYAIALTQGKGRLVEGSIVGSLLAGVLLMPGSSMCSGAIRRKEQKFNAKSAGVTSTMLIMAIIGTMTPTLFYQTFGNFQLACDRCSDTNPGNATWTCQHCSYRHPDPVEDPFYQSTVKSLMYLCAGVLLFSYLVGLWFSLRTHASQIWQNPQQLLQSQDHPRVSFYPRVSTQSAVGPGALHATEERPDHKTGFSGDEEDSHSRSQTPVPHRRYGQGLTFQPNTAVSGDTPQDTGASAKRLSSVPATMPMPSVGMTYTPLFESVDHAIQNTGLHPTSLIDNMTTEDFTRAVAAATVSALRHQQIHSHAGRLRHGDGNIEGEELAGHGSHDGPSWSRLTSASVLLGCTALYAIIAELLVDVVDVVLEGSGINEKFLGVTLFALVPNTTEFMNAMSFAMNGNIALSMEIGSAYALQVCLLQIPAMVAFSAWYDPAELGEVASTFTLIFPRWDVIAIILSIFLLTYTYIEAKANYHRGTILILSYFVLVSGFFFAPS